jgi:hypothetical protein
MPQADSRLAPSQISVEQVATQINGMIAERAAERLRNAPAIDSATETPRVKTSQIQLGSAPQGYEEMRADIRKFYRSFHSGGTFQLTDADCVRWVWLALRDGAELAIKENTVLYAGPD